MKKLGLILIGVIFVCFTLKSPQIANADIAYVSGDQTGTWSADTVIVMGDVRVPPGAALTIAPGVEVYFWVYSKIIVDSNAVLTAVGAVNDSIRFNESWDWPNNGWHGIRFLSASNASRLQYCHFKNGYAWGTASDADGGAIHCSFSSPTIRNCRIDSCEATGSGGAIYCDPNSSPAISNNILSDNLAWDYGGAIYCGSYSSPAISGNLIDANMAWDFGGGIYCGSFSNPSITANTVTNNVALDYGGGIYCGSNSSLSIDDNTISGNTATIFGGGIYCGTFSNPGITNNTISGNDADLGGGLYCSSSSYSQVNGNDFSGNISTNGGAIYCSSFASPVIADNTISNNTANDGGGIYCFDFSLPAISGNVISYNVALDDGGGIFLTWSSPTTFELNDISMNTAADNGGGIFMIYSDPVLNKNTIAGDTAETGGGIAAMSSNPTLRNCIVWGNVPQQIHQTLGSNVQANYSDIGYYTVWPGAGNLNEDPLFVYPGQGDYRIRWGSPCIDAGDPAPIFNDPDGTRADMGCYYYDQGTGLRITLTPFNEPLEFGTSGGAFNYFVQLTNNAPVPLAVSAWLDVTLPNGATYGPVLGPVNLNMLPSAVVGQEMSQNVPPGAPVGEYLYNAWAVAGADTSHDSFTFVKLESGGSDGMSGWFNSGSLFPDENSGEDAASAIPDEATLAGAYPNPFNPATTIAFALPREARVSLTVYDAAGRQVATLVDGYRSAGSHEVTFNASNLASGIYFYRLAAENFTATGKLVLLK
jgi:predicted outer membrane repeat protein